MALAEEQHGSDRTAGENRDRIKRLWISIEDHAFSLHYVLQLQFSRFFSSSQTGWDSTQLSDSCTVVNLELLLTSCALQDSS
ncbi:hypothetical protein SRHO_G00310360 [Serrasalmus rhombeus]